MLPPGKSRRCSPCSGTSATSPRTRCAGSSTSASASASSCPPWRQGRDWRHFTARDARRGASARSSREGASSLAEWLPEGSRFAVLASGSGTNLQALLNAYPRELVVVAGDKKGAFAFERARRAGVPVEHVDPEAFASRKAFDLELADRISRYDVRLVVGAGYMRILTPAFLERFPAVIKVHPSLLPEFKGLHAVKRTL